MDEDEAGQVFRGQCAELCGTGHRIMLFTVNALTPAAYDAWLGALVAKSSATPAPLPSGPVLNIIAKGIAFDTKELEVAADTPFAIVFDNQDPPGARHDVDIRAEDKVTVVQDQPTIDGGTSTNYLYEALPAGTYTFICSIHPIPAMTGTLTVK